MGSKFTKAERLVQQMRRQIEKKPVAAPPSTSVERKEVQMREVPILQWENAYNNSWRDLIVPEAFAH